MNITQNKRKELIDTCINRVFQKNCIKHISKKNKWSPGAEEIFFDIKGKEITITEGKQPPDKLRVNFLINLLKVAISRYNLDINCNIIFNLMDGISAQEHYTRICISASLDSNHILMPDPHLFYHINTFKQNHENDPRFEEKQAKIIFYGSDTGLVGQDLLNQRIKFCAKAFNNPKVTSKITNFVHFSKELLEDLNINIEDIKAEYQNIPQQLKSKYILDIDGNVASWDRTPWAMASNSYLIHLESDTNNSVNWYYPFIQQNGILPIYKEEDILNGKVFYDSNIKQKQKDFAEILLSEETQIEYFSCVLRKYNEIFNS